MRRNGATKKIDNGRSVSVSGEKPDLPIFRKPTGEKVLRIKKRLHGEKFEAEYTLAEIQKAFDAA